jgi:hypothetical protein
VVVVGAVVFVGLVFGFARGAVDGVDTAGCCGCVGGLENCSGGATAGCGCGGTDIASREICRREVRNGS